MLKKGDRFGRLTVIREVMRKAQPSGQTKARYLCSCGCGSEKVVLMGSLKAGNTKSCGCLAKEGNPGTRTHGMSKTRPYGIWCYMHKRCTDEKGNRYHRYGGRGIKVCKRWNKFENFWEDMKATYEPHLTIDRDNNDGDYNKENCKWSTPKTQSNNRSTNHMVEYEGEFITVMQLSELVDMKYGTLIARLNKGMTLEETLNTPLRRGRWK